MLPVAGTLLLIDAGPESLVSRLMLSRPPVVRLGLVSYALYLWHWPMLAFAKLMLMDDQGTLFTLGLMLLALALAEATVRLIERPIRSLEGGSWVKPILTAHIVLFVLAFVIDRDKGVYRRWPPAPGAFAKDIAFNFPQNIRLGTCHAEGPKEDRPRNCYETKRPLVALWGDSNAAMLYPGLKHLQNDLDFGIAQVTQGSCPPLFDLPSTAIRKNCNTLNLRVLDEMVQIQPDVIILGAAFVHPHYPLTANQIEQKLLASVHRIRRYLPEVRLLLVGPPVLWKKDLNQLVAMHMKNRGLTAPPERLTYGYDHERFTLDRKLASLAHQIDLPYASVTDIMCDDNSCLASLGPRPDQLVSSDGSHLSAPASEYVVRLFADRLKQMIQP